MPLPTPYYLIDECRMQPTMERLQRLQQLSGARCVLALKCFSSWCAFDYMRGFFAGTTSSSPWEARLGHEKFGGETHGYAVAYDESEVLEIAPYCDKIVFNSLTQLERLAPHAGQAQLGLRLNPEIGSSHHELSNPVGRYSRLGVRAERIPHDLGSRIRGAMIHVNCDNADFASFCRQLERIAGLFGPLLHQLEWLSLGGGISFTADTYPLDALAERLRTFSAEFGLQLYLEPGEAAVMNSTSLTVRVLDIVENEVPTLVVDAGVEPHLLDVLTYGYTPDLEGARILERDSVRLGELEGHVYRVCGRTCLAGDLFGNYCFDRAIAIGQLLHFPDVGAYSMVKKNYFNGIRMPSTYHRRLDGELRLVQRPTYDAFRDALSSDSPAPRHSLNAH
ncbi:MAG TPA: carboxynorspermidine decarboxylase [Polyangiaceae bacterium]|nr:carboxynorspermidine decarboxylase [Polyangiaceae bacterium]